MKVVFVRLDKIGDLIATLPVDQLSFLQPGRNEIKWVLAEGLGFLASAADPSREFLELSLKTPENSFWRLYDFLKKEKLDASVMFYGPWWAAFALWLARVPLRGGRKSQWYSFLFFNRGLRQSRSLAEKHEADYNRELVETCFKKNPEPAASAPASTSTPRPLPAPRAIATAPNDRGRSAARAIGVTW